MEERGITFAHMLYLISQYPDRWLVVSLTIKTVMMAYKRNVKIGLLGVTLLLGVLTFMAALLHDPAAYSLGVITGFMLALLIMLILMFRRL